MDIYLVHPVFLSQNRAERELMSPYFPLGLLYLAAFLRERAFSVDIFDGSFQNGPEDFAAAIAEGSPQVVGIGVVRPNREMALQLAAIAHRRGAFVIFGGPDPTMEPEFYLRQPQVDAIVHHEGELTTAEMLEALLRRGQPPEALIHLPGTAWRGPDGAPIVNPRRPYILNLDELSLPARDLIDMEQYLQTWRQENGYTSLTLSISRGCPYGCRWCQDAVHGPELRRRSPESVAAEVKMLKQRYSIDRLRLVDDVDGIDREWLEAWERAAQNEDAVLPFEALNDLQRKDIPMLDVRDSL